MCLIFIAINQHPRYKLIIAANRDEFYNRQTESAHFWKMAPTILAGKDLKANGTWMGVTKEGKIGMLTNFRDPKNINPLAPSRGQLVVDFFMSKQKPELYLQQIEQNNHPYNGYNLIVGNINELWYLSNYQHTITLLQNGIYGVSNHLLDTPWPKVKLGKKKFGDIVQSDQISQIELFEFLYDTHVAPDKDLPDTGIGRERERALSSMFIKYNGYGTRSSTVILIDQNNQIEFTERVYDTTHFSYSTNTFKINPSTNRT